MKKFRMINNKEHLIMTRYEWYTVPIRFRKLEDKQRFLEYYDGNIELKTVPIDLEDNLIRKVKKEYGLSYCVVYWGTQDDIELGMSHIHKSNIKLEEAIIEISKIVGELAISAEVRVNNPEEDSILYCGPDNEYTDKYVTQWLV